MKTIEARAKEWADVLINTDSNHATKEIAELSYMEGATEQREIDVEDIFNHVGQYLRNNILSCIIDQGGKRVLELDLLMANMIEDYKTTKVYTAKGTYHKKGE